MATVLPSSDLEKTGILSMSVAAVVVLRRRCTSLSVHADFHVNETHVDPETLKNPQKSPPTPYLTANVLTPAPPPSASRLRRSFLHSPQHPWSVQTPRNLQTLLLRQPPSRFPPLWRRRRLNPLRRRLILREEFIEVWEFNVYSRYAVDYWTGEDGGFLLTA